MDKVFVPRGKPTPSFLTSWPAAHKLAKEDTAVPPATAGLGISQKPFPVWSPIATDAEEARSVICIQPWSRRGGGRGRPDGPRGVMPKDAI